MNQIDFSSIKVLVIGDVMIDKYIHGNCSKISPEAPVPVLNYKNEISKLGGAANVAYNLKNLGAKVELLGIAGQDRASHELESILDSKKIKYQIEKVKSACTIQKVRYCANNHQLIRVDHEDSFEFHDKSTLFDSYAQSILDKDVIILSDYAKGTLTNSLDLIKRANSLNIPVIVDPKGLDFSKYKGSFALTPNLHEYEAIVGICKSDEDIYNKGKAMLKDLNLSSLIITRGSDGMTIIDSKGNINNIKALALDVIDVTGAGDTVISVLAASIGSGLSIMESAKIANHAASIVVQTFGTSTINAADLSYK